MFGIFKACIVMTIENIFLLNIKVRWLHILNTWQWMVVSRIYIHGNDSISILFVWIRSKSRTIEAINWGQLLWRAHVIRGIAALRVRPILTKPGRCIATEICRYKVCSISEQLRRPFPPCSPSKMGAHYSSSGICETVITHPSVSIHTSC